MEVNIWPGVFHQLPFFFFFFFVKSHRQCLSPFDDVVALSSGDVRKHQTRTKYISARSLRILSRVFLLHFNFSHGLPQINTLLGLNESGASIQPPSITSRPSLDLGMEKGKGKPTEKEEDDDASPEEEEEEEEEEHKTEE